MADVVSKETRSRMMSGIRSRNTKPERILRRAMHQHGFRYRLNRPDLPGKPDIVLPKYRAVIFVHGCFWHVHDCKLFKWPRSNNDFWQNKLLKNAARDVRSVNDLLVMKWRIAQVWECSLKGPTRMDITQLVEKIAVWLKSDIDRLTIP